MKYHGFSLIEVVVSGAIVATTVGALFAAASMTVRLTSLGQDRMIASQLGREGLEIAHMSRDNNFLNDQCQTVGEQACDSWHANLYSGPGLELHKIDTNANGSYDFGTTLTDPNVCSDYIYRDSTGNLTDTPTPIIPIPAKSEFFCRRVYVEPIPQNQLVAGSQPNPSIVDAVRVYAQVLWAGNGKNGNPLTTTCQSTAANASVWCDQQVSILTNWRANE